MTVPATTRRAGPFTGNGVTTSFPFTFKVFAADDIQFTTADADGRETLRVLGSDYSVTLNPDQDASPGGSVTYPLSGAPLAPGHTAAIKGAVEYTQELDLPGGGSFSPTALENALDRTTMQVQQLAEEVGRSLTLPVTAAGADTELPVPEAGKVIAWNNTGTGLVNVDSGDLASVVVAGTAYTDVFDGTGAQTVFTLSTNPGSVHALDIAISGVSQVNGVDFNVSGTTLTFAAAPPAGTGNVAVRYVAALPSGTSDSSAVTFTPAGAGAVTRTLQGKLRDSVSILDFIPAAEHAAIAAATSTYDCYAAIVAAVDSVTYQGTFLGGPYRAGPAIYFPPGLYECSSTLHLKKRVTLYGDGSGMAYGDAAIIRWAADTTGIVVHSRFTDATNSGAVTTGADASILHGLALVSAGGAGTTFHGVWMRARATVERCYLENFPGDGYHINADTAGGWNNAYAYAVDDCVQYDGVAYKSLQAGNLNKTPGSEPLWWAVGVTNKTGNANSWRIVGGRVNDCTGHGIYVRGGDANAGKADCVDSSANGGWGIYDASFLGNSYDACHTASNGLGAYKSDNANARNLFSGCYSESGQPASDLTGEATAPGASSSAIVVGGIHAAGFTAGTTAAILENGIGNFSISNAVTRPVLGLDFSTTTRTATATVLDAYTESISHTPTGTGITTTGTPTYGWQATRVGNRVDFRLTIGVTAGTNAYTAGASYVTLPAGLTPTAGAACMATTTAVAQVGICYIGSDGRVYLPTWAASAATVIVSGSYFVSSTA